MILSLLLNAGSVNVGVTGVFSSHALTQKKKTGTASNGKSSEWGKSEGFKDQKLNAAKNASEDDATDVKRGNGFAIEGNLGYVHNWSSFFAILEFSGGGVFGGKQKMKTPALTKVEVEGMIDAKFKALEKERDDNALAASKLVVGKGPFADIGAARKDGDDGVKAAIKKVDDVYATELTNLTTDKTKAADKPAGEDDLLNVRGYIGIALKPGFMVMEKLGVHAIVGMQIFFPKTKVAGVEETNTMLGWTVGAGTCYSVTDSIGVHAFYTYTGGFGTENKAKSLKLAVDQHKVGLGVSYAFKL